MNIDMDFENYKSKLKKQQLQLLEAVKTSDLRMVRKIAQQLEKSDELFGYILVVTALHEEHEYISKYLIQEGWPVRVPQKTGVYNTPLYYAVKMNDLEILKELWKKGASLFDKDANKESALELALMDERKSKLIHSLLDYIRTDEERKSPEPDSESDIALFHAACRTNNHRAVEMFISHNFSVTSRSSFENDEWAGFTPLHFALVSSSSSSQTLSILHKHDDVDFHAQDKRGRTCVHLCFRNRLNFLYSEKDTIIECIRRLQDNEITEPNMNPLANPVDENGLSHFHIFCAIKICDRSCEKRVDLIKYFIDSGVDVNSSVSLEDKDVPGFTALHFAAQQPSMEISKTLLENGADITKTDQNGRTPLHLVCACRMVSKDRLEIINLFLHYGADPMAKDSEDRTALHYLFCANQDVSPLDECGKLLLSKSEEGVNHTDKSGLSYLHIACTGDDLDIVKTLISNGSQIDTCTQSESTWKSSYSALHVAVKLNKSELVEILLTHGADPNCAGDTKITPLHLVCDHSETEFFYPIPWMYGYSNTKEVDWLPSRTSQIQIIELLVKHGACVNAEDSLGRSPLQNNCLGPYKEISFDSKSAKTAANEVLTRKKMIVNILTSHGANINYSHKENESVLHMLTRDFWRSPLAKDLAELALMKGADVNAINGHGSTPLNIAFDQAISDSLDLSMIDLLLKYGALIEAGNYFYTPLHSTLKSKGSSAVKLEIFDMLLRYDHINLNAKDGHGQTALHLATSRRKLYHIEKLLEHGADVNQADDNRLPPMSCFVSSLTAESNFILRRDNRKIVKTLVTHVKKLLRLNLFVSRIVKHLINMASQFLSKDDLALIDSEIEKQLQNLKERKLNKYTSFFDILFKNSHEMSKHVKNSKLQRAISSIRSKSDFTFLGYFIKRAFDEGRERLKLLEPAEKILNSITNVSWPDCCSDRILSYFSNKDLMGLMDFESFKKTRGRSTSLSVLEEAQTKVRRCE